MDIRDLRGERNGDIMIFHPFCSVRTYQGEDRTIDLWKMGDETRRSEPLRRMVMVTDLMSLNYGFEL